MDIQAGSIVTIKPTKSASSYTKKCILKYGKSGFEIVGFDPNSWLFGNTPAVRLKSVITQKNKTAWLGWLSLLEIDSV